MRQRRFAVYRVAFPFSRRPAQWVWEDDSKAHMADQDDILSLEEIGRIFHRLRQPDLLRIAALARVWVQGDRKNLS